MKVLLHFLKPCSFLIKNLHKMDEALPRSNYGIRLQLHIKL